MAICNAGLQEAITFICDAGSLWLTQHSSFPISSECQKISFLDEGQIPKDIYCHGSDDNFTLWDSLL